MEELNQVQKPVQWQRARNGLEKFIQLIKRNPINSLLFFFAGIVLLQIIFLPYGDIERLKKKNPIETMFMREHAAKAKKEVACFRKGSFGFL